MHGITSPWKLMKRGWPDELPILHGDMCVLITVFRYVFVILLRGGGDVR